MPTPADTPSTEDRPASETNPQVIVDFVVEEVLLPLGGCVADRSYTGPELARALDSAGLLVKDGEQ